MKKIFIIFLMLGIAPIMVGCSPESSPEGTTGVIPEHQLKALEKAKETEGLLQDLERDRQKQLEE